MRRPFLIALGAWLSLASLSGAGAQSDTPPPPGSSGARAPEINPSKAPDDDHGLLAPLVIVDRFSDVAATLLRRSVDPTLPAPGAPFSLDDPRFTLAVTGPGGATARCYNLDVRPSRPRRYYVFYDTIGNYRIGQFPVVDAIPGDPGYSDLWDIWKVVTPNAFRETNWLRDAATVEKLIADPSSGYKASSTGIFLNGPIVPDGTTASMKGESRAGTAALMYAWYDGKRAPYLYLEGSLRLAADRNVPTGVLLSSDAPVSWPPRKPLTDASWPKMPAYTPLVEVKGRDGLRIVNGFLNCPIVGTAAP